MYRRTFNAFNARLSDIVHLSQTMIFELWRTLVMADRFLNKCARQIFDRLCIKWQLQHIMSSSAAIQQSGSNPRRLLPTCTTQSSRFVSWSRYNSGIFSLANWRIVIKSQSFEMYCAMSWSITISWTIVVLCLFYSFWSTEINIMSSISLHIFCIHLYL